MTFFANSGITWPKFERETREAGAHSLDAASRIWKLLAYLEDRYDRNFDQDEIANCASSLDLASNIYSDIADQLKYEIIPGVTAAELDLASVNFPIRHSIYGSPRRYQQSFFYALFLDDDISLGRLYLELSQRSAHLAASVRALDIKRESKDLAPQAFQLMKQWEILAILGRIVAVLNRRIPRGG